MENEKEVRFDLYCKLCKHWDPAGKYNEQYEIITHEEYYPCCDCLITAVREGTMVPEYWEEK